MSAIGTVDGLRSGTAGIDAGRAVRLRCNLAFSAFLLGAAVLAAHLFFLQFERDNREHYIASVEDRWHSYECPQGRRGNICFRDGSLIAGNRKVARVIVEPELVTDVEAVASVLGQYCDQNPQELGEKIESFARPGMVVADGLPLETALAIDNEHLRGVFTRYHYERYYPHGAYGAATTVGFAGREPVHRLGLESSFDELLSGKDGRIVFKRDAGSNRLPGSIRAEEPRIDGADIVTTLHPAIQAICEDELRKAVDSHDPDSVSIIVMQPQTGEVMAAATWPTFDPNEYVDGKIGDQQNVLVHAPLEPGSTIKPLLAAYALEQGWLNPTKHYVCNRYLKVDGYTIREAEASHLVGDSNGVPIHEIIAKSSNIGMAQVAMELGQRRVLEAFEGLGFFGKSGIELPVEETGSRPFWYAQRKSKKELRWPKSTLANTGFGQALSMTPLQLATAYCTLANGGYLVKPTLVREISSKEPEGTESVEQAPSKAQTRNRVLSEHTCETAREWLTSAVEAGTGKRAKLARFNAAGKTGTGQIAGRGGYQRGAYTASFAGYFPAEHPSYVVLVMVVHPKNGLYYGGEVAAPVFKAVGDRISFLDQLQPREAVNAD